MRSIRFERGSSQTGKGHSNHFAPRMSYHTGMRRSPRSHSHSPAAWPRNLKGQRRKYVRLSAWLATPGLVLASPLFPKVRLTRLLSIDDRACGTEATCGLADIRVAIVIARKWIAWRVAVVASAMSVCVLRGQWGLQSRLIDPTHRRKQTHRCVAPAGHMHVVPSALGLPTPQCLQVPEGILMELGEHTHDVPSALGRPEPQSTHRPSMAADPSGGHTARHVAPSSLINEPGTHTHVVPSFDAAP